MKVLIPNHFPLEGSGSGIYTQNVARELVRQGHEAVVITPSHEPQDGYPFQVRSILFSPNTEGAGSPDSEEAGSVDAEGAGSDVRLLTSLQAQASELDLQGIHFLGHQAQDNVARIMNVSDLAVVPSRVEPFGLVAIEALACGTPVIATNQGGLPEFVNEKVGALVDVDDAQGLAAAVMREIESDSKRVKGPIAADYARKGFSWSTQVSKMIELYETAI
jgi:glycosyltransferase involved in cell wall biosynthesis